MNPFLLKVPSGANLDICSGSMPQEEDNEAARKKASRVLLYYYDGEVSSEVVSA